VTVLCSKFQTYSDQFHRKHSGAIICIVIKKYLHLYNILNVAGFVLDHSPVCIHQLHNLCGRQ
jgi:hypothetical protein